jgi:carbonic anhydrase
MSERQQPDLLGQLLAANRDYAEQGHEPESPVAPRLHLAVVTCMDARLVPPEALGLRPGDAHIIRNAGGRVTDDALRSLAVSCSALGVRNVLVLPHTGCGMHTSEQRLRAAIERVSGHDGPRELHAFTDADAALSEDVERIRQAPFLPEDLRVWGARFDVETGRVHIEIDA